MDERAVVKARIFAVRQLERPRRQAQIVRRVAQGQAPNHIMVTPDLSPLKVDIDIGFFAPKSRQTRRRSKGYGRTGPRP